MELEELLNKQEGSPQVYHLLFRCLLEEKELEKAEHHMKNFQKNYTAQPADHKLFGQIKMEQSKFREAIPHFNKALHISYKDAEMLNMRGEAILQLGEYAIAEKDFDSAYLYRPGYIPALINRGIARIKSDRSAEGAQDLLQALENNPYNPNCHLNLGYYYELEGDYEKAIFHFEQAKELGLEHYGLQFYIEEVRKKLN